MCTDSANEGPTPCTVCLNSPMKPPIYHCVNGHCLCVECEGRLTTCPSCRVDLPQEQKIRCLALERWQAHLLKKCKHEGCSMQCLTSEEIEVHERQDCEFKTWKICAGLGIDKNCKKEFRLNETGAASEHLRTAHGEDLCCIVEPVAERQEGSCPKFWLGITDELLSEELSGFLAFMLLKTKGNRRLLIPLVFGPRSKTEQVQVTVSLWIGEKKRGESEGYLFKTKDFVESPSTLRTQTTGNAKHVVRYDPSQPQAFAIDAGPIQNISCIFTRWSNNAPA